MIEVVWDKNLKPTVAADSVSRWDAWFAATGDDESMKAWAAAKSVYTNSVELERWASIIEMNRLDRYQEKSE